jgi:hypothetical protein
MRNGAFILILTSCCMAFLGCSTSKRFTLPVLPDTQGEVGYKTQMVKSQLEWIVNNKHKRRIPIVLHVGDVVDWNNIGHYRNADTAFKILDNAGVPYALAVGNHDTEAVGEHSGSAAPGNVNANLRKTTKLNTFFPVSRMIAQKGQYEPGKIDNAYYTFKQGGLYWLVITLEFCPRQGPVDWANTIVSRFPNHNTIILTHYFLTPRGTINQTNAGYGDLSSQAVYDDLVKKHANILMVISGHVCYSAHRTDTGDHGNIVYELLQDYQNEDYGGGYIRLLEIDPKNKSISAKMYSPFYDKEKRDSSNFSFSGVKFTRP